MNCPHCQAEVPVGSQVCPQCQRALPALSLPGAPQRNQDSPSFGMAILGFFIPLLGAILWLATKGSTPKKAASAGRGALVGLLTSCVLFVGLGLSVRHFAGTYLAAIKKMPVPAVKTIPGQEVSVPAATFGQTAFVSVARGRSKAEAYVDWANFSSAGSDIGPIYAFMPGEEAKAGFRKSFITSFSQSFLGKGATPESITGWRVESEDASQATVTAKAPSGRDLVLTLSKRDGFWRIKSIDLK